MKKILGFLFLLLIFTVSCSTTPKISPEEIKMMTTRVYKYPMKDVYTATRNVIVNREFNLLSSSLEDGLIKGYAEVQTSDEAFNVLIGSKVTRSNTIDAVLTSRGEDVEVRLLVSEQFKDEDGIGILDVLSFNFKTSKETTKLTPIYNVELYNKLFDEIQKELSK
ncbi:hypothetical protein STFE110948_05595 [Streptobacillus felis]|uniref:DUF4468 domain-containing protein n=1 Tax=Streptobacillus felis TaxID=1384509 RepID=A0A7Z0PGF7_9FUSO|nr:hypothetical protein [Streptobacillus felis]NYV28248.1 hypothetical protein [Streptobacillus felis]